MNTDTLLLFVALLLFISVNTAVNIYAGNNPTKVISFIGVLVGIIAAWYLLGLSFIAYLPTTGGQP